MRLTRGTVQPSEARREIQTVVEKAEVGDVSIVRRERSLLFEKENRSGYNNYFGRNMRYLKSNKGINRKNCSPQCYQLSLSGAKNISIASTKNSPPSKVHPI